MSALQMSDRGGPPTAAAVGDVPGGVHSPQRAVGASRREGGAATLAPRAARLLTGGQSVTQPPASSLHPFPRSLGRPGLNRPLSGGARSDRASVQRREIAMAALGRITAAG